MRIAHPHTFDILLIPDREWVSVDPGVKEVNVMAHHGLPFLPKSNIVQFFSRAGTLPSRLLIESIDRNSCAIMIKDKANGLPESMD